MSKISFFSLLLILPLFSLPDCSLSQEEKPSLFDNVVAIVNQEYIYKNEYERGLRQFMSRYKVRPSQVNRHKEEGSPEEIVLNELIQNKLFDQEIRRQNLTVSMKKWGDELRTLTGERSPEDLAKRLKERNITFARWKNEVRRAMLLKKLVKREVLAKLTVGESEMRAYYEKHPDAFSYPERVEVFQIIVPNELDAHSIYDELRAGADFEETAKKNSMGLESSSGGYMGLFSKGQLPEQFDKVIFNLSPGRFSHVIATPYGFHIVKVTKVLKAKKMGFGEAKEKIRKILVKEKEEGAYAQWLNHLKTKAKIVINKKYFIKGQVKTNGTAHASPLRKAWHRLKSRVSRLNEEWKSFFSSRTPSWNIQNSSS